MPAGRAYRFARPDVRHPAFAVVEVCVHADGAGEEPPADPQSERPLPEWVMAAESGASAMLHRLISEGRVARDCAVRVLRVEGHVAHTRVDAVRCAAGLAVFRTLLPDDAEPETEYDER